MNRSLNHQRLVDDLLFAFGSRRDVRCWIRNVGVARTLDGKSILQYGMVGESDIQGIVAPTGKFLCIEAKTGDAKQTKQQIRFETMIKNFGGIYILARSVEQALADFESQL